MDCSKGSLSLCISVLLLLMSGCGREREAKKGGVEERGTLVFTANGEDFVRQGFTTKDGWRIDFDTVLINIDSPTAFQRQDNAGTDTDLSVPENAPQAALDGSRIAELAAGDENAPPIELGRVPRAPAGNYNGLRFGVRGMEEHGGASLLIKGKASRGETTLPFSLGFDQQCVCLCEGYVGEEIKGILSGQGEAEVEMTFHFDHLFGDADTPAEEDLNVHAPGFDFFARFAKNGAVTLNPEDLRTTLTDQEQAMFAEIIIGLAHVGEGHCTCKGGAR